MFADYHVHTDFSPDSNQNIEKTVLSAIKNRIKEICFTDHIDFDSTDKSYNYEFDLDEYFNTIQSLKEKYNKDISLKFGVEMGLQPHVLRKCEKFIESKPFDFVIASMHCCNKKDFYLGDFFKNISAKEGILAYYKELLLMLEDYKSYNVIGHLDIYKRYNPSCINVKLNDYSHMIEAVLKNIINSNKGIEINTSGLRTDLNESLPTSSILEIYYELGGKILTIGSDSHTEDTLCGNFPQVIDTIKRIGFKEVFIFNQMIPEPIKISSLL